MSVGKVLATIQTAGKPIGDGQIAEVLALERKEVDKAMRVIKAKEKIVSPKRCHRQPETDQVVVLFSDLFLLVFCSKIYS